MLADGVRHEIQIVLNSGKAPEYLEAEARRFGGRFVISGNGAAWREVGGPTRRFVPPCPDLAAVRRLLGVAADARDVVFLELEGRRVQAALEDKRDAQGDIVVSFFPEPEPVSHRWSFVQGTDRWELTHHLRALIDRHGLALEVPDPHPDGAVDLLPLVEGRPVGKWSVPRLARQMFPDARLHLTHAGNGRNDLDALETPDVLPMTAANCEACLEAVRVGGGVVAGREAPEGGAVLECYAELARRGFYGPLSEAVARICAASLEKVDA